MAVTVGKVSTDASFPRLDSSSIEEDVSEIEEFFDGRCVFITGAAGFLGSILLETLLRCCPGITKIYILLREKKGVAPADRREQIFKKKIFTKLKKTSPEALEKTEVVSGDMTLENLGIPDSRMVELEENVSVVFHCAAIVSFRKSLKSIVNQNVLGTENVVNFSRKLKNLAVFVHTSTAYSFCNRFKVEETVPKLQVDPMDIIDAARRGDEETLNALAAECLPAWPNTYTFSKAICEDFLSRKCRDIPLAIVRPSVIVSTWKGVLPGYTEEGIGITDVSLGIGKGFIRVLLCDPDKVVDIIPADIVANTLLTTAWYVHKQKPKDLLVVHCGSSVISPTTWGYFINTLYHMQEINPLPKMYQKPFLVMRKNLVTYWASALVNHYAPALCIDVMLTLMGKKPKLTRLYLFYDLAVKYLRPFLLNEWRFSCENYKMLISSQCSKDREEFPINIKGFSIDSIAKSLKTGAPFYEWETDKRKFSDRIPIAYRRYVLTTFIKWMAITWFLIFIGLIISKTFFRGHDF